MGLANATFEVKDAAKLDVKEKFDLITVFDAIHDQAKPRDVLKNISNALKPDGVFLCVDIAASSNLEENLEHPLGPMLYAISTMHCMTVSLALDGEGLGTVWGDQLARELLGEAGIHEDRCGERRRRHHERVLHRAERISPGQSMDVARGLPTGSPLSRGRMILP